MTPSLRDLPPLLLPAPRSVRRGDGWLALDTEMLAWIAASDHELSRAPHSPLPRQVACRITGGWCGAKSTDSQSYRMHIGTGPIAHAGAITIEAPSRSGVRHARSVLRQLVTQYEQSTIGESPSPLAASLSPASPPTTRDAITIPTLTIEDSPTFATRGVMLDVSRCRISTMEEFARLIPWLASLRCNHLQLYTEHTFAYAGCEVAWQGWDPITPGELCTLDALCTQHGIELAANQNCFGHMAQWLKHERFAHLAETHGDWMFDVWPRRGPHSLCPTDPASIAFVRELLSQLLPCVRSERVNIGCDETYDIAFGRSAAAVKERGRGEVFMDHVLRVCDVAREFGKVPMLWADIALSHPECLARLPVGTTALAWGYEPDTPFDAWCATLREHGVTPWVCPGTSSWCSIVGRTRERTANISAAASQGARAGAEGFLICDWGDHGHWQQWPVAARGIADGLSAAWSGSLALDGASLAHHQRTVSLHALDDRSLSAAAWLDELGDADAPLRSVCLGLARPGMSGMLRNQSAAFADFRLSARDRADVGPLPMWRNALARVEGLAAHPCAASNPELRAAWHLTRAMLTRATHRRTTPSHRERSALHEDLVRAKDDLTHLWPLRSRRGGLAHSLEFFTPALQELAPA